MASAVRIIDRYLDDMFDELYQLASKGNEEEVHNALYLYALTDDYAEWLDE